MSSILTDIVAGENHIRQFFHNQKNWQDLQHAKHFTGNVIVKIRFISHFRAVIGLR